MMLMMLFSPRRLFESRGPRSFQGIQLRCLHSKLSHQQLETQTASLLIQTTELLFIQTWIPNDDLGALKLNKNTLLLPNLPLSNTFASYNISITLLLCCCPSNCGGPFWIILNRSAVQLGQWSAACAIKCKLQASVCKTCWSAITLQRVCSFAFRSSRLGFEWFWFFVLQQCVFPKLQKHEICS